MPDLTLVVFGISDPYGSRRDDSNASPSSVYVNGTGKPITPSDSSNRRPLFLEILSFIPSSLSGWSSILEFGFLTWSRFPFQGVFLVSVPVPVCMILSAMSFREYCNWRLSLRKGNFFFLFDHLMFEGRVRRRS